jgi:aminoglycoside phosphotransferase family enzyme
MRRFDETGRLDHVAACGALKPEQVAQLAASLYAFHSGAPVAPPGSRFGEPARIADAARENFVELRQLLPRTDQPRIEALAAWTEDRIHPARR